MSFRLESVSEDTSIVHVGDKLDFRNASEFKSTCKKNVQEGVRNFILDFGETGILDSTGLGAIFSLYRQLNTLDGQVVFANISRPVEVVIQLTRTYKVFRQYTTVEEAQEAVMEADTSTR
jgi:anti-sigma B factor antagonist